MLPVESYDILVFGGGKGGKTLAMEQAKAGRRVALIEAGMIGGSCINIACIPSKTLIRSAEMAEYVRRAGAFGIDIADGSVDMARVAARTAGVVHGMVDVNRSAFAASGLELVVGWGRFVAARTISVETASGTRRLTGERIYLNLGTRAALPDIPGLAQARPMTHVEALLLAQMPNRLVVMGGGYVGMEMAAAFRRLGSDVQILEAGPRLADREDDDVAAAIAATFEGNGIQVATDARAARVDGRSGESISVETLDGRTFSGTHLLVAAGRRAMTSDIGLEIAGVSITKSGFVVVNEALQTTAPGIWALGEVAGSPMFTHVSLDDFRVASSGISGGDRSTKGRLVPHCLFIDPEYARIGLGESEARKMGVAYRTARLSMDLVPRARTMSATEGFMKCLVSAADDQILGFAMLGERAGEVMTIVQTAMLARLPFPVLRDAILAHPTIAEGLGMLLAGVPPLDR